MCDAFLVLAQADGGLSCFLLPRVLPDGTRNAIPHPAAQGQARQPLQRVQRGRVRRRLGPDGRRGGPRRATIIEMVNHTRLDCVLGSTAGDARRRWRRRRTTPRTASAFGKLLAEQPLMQNVLADLCIESEAATVTAMRLARAYDDRRRRARDAVPPPRDRRRQVLGLQARPRARARRWSASAARATSRSRACRGSTARRRSTRSGRARAMSSAWTSCGRWCAAPQSVEIFMSEVREGAAAEPRLAAFADSAREPRWPTSPTSRSARGESWSGWPSRSRGRCWSAMAIRRWADAFCATRLGADWGRAFGTLPPGVDFDAIVERHTPHV